MTTATCLPSARHLATAARVALVLAVLAVLAVGAARPAAAHDSLVGSSPADGSTTDVPTEVVLQFDAAVAEEFSTVVVTGPDGEARSAGEAAVDGTEVRQPVSAGPTGAWTVDYRVVSSDGHPITGRIAFTVAASEPDPQRTTSVPVPDLVAAPGPAEEGEEAPRTAAENALLFLVVAVVLAPFALLAAFAVRRVRSAG